MTVKLRLLLLALSTTVGLGALSALNDQQTRKVFDTASYAAVNTVPTYQSFFVIRATLANLRERSLFHVIITDEAGMRALEPELERFRKELGDELKRYVTSACGVATCMSDEKEQKMYDEVLSLLAAYDVERLAVFDLSKANKTREAEKAVRTRLMPATERLVHATQVELDYNAELAQAAVMRAEETKEQALRWSVGLAVAVTALVALMSFFMARTLTRQLGAEPPDLAGATQRMAKGDLTARLPTGERDTTSVAASVNAMVQHLASVIGQVRATADSLASASEELASSAQSVSSSSTEQSASIEETSSTMEEMTASIARNNESARLTGDIALRTAKEATEGGAAVRETVAAMRSIAQKIAVIDDIAYQTNLLALNAAIEAGRAGEHGRGFAVVAAEVRKLAERSQVAAEEISNLARSSVTLAERAGGLLDAIVPSVQKTADLVREISAATGEQATGVSQSNTALAQVSQAIQQNASSSEELAATSRSVSDQAVGLQNAMAFFTVASSQEPALVTFQAPRPKASTDAPGAPPPARPGEGGQFVSF
jgi:methyl-accepting chemotaxis protein